MVRGEFDGMVVKFSQFAPTLPPYPFAPKSLDIEAARLNVRFPKVLESMLFTSKTLKDIAYIEAMGGEDFGDIAKIAMRTAILGSQDPQTVIRIVYGGTTQIPLRSLTGFIPALIYMERFKNAGLVVPQLQMISADNLSSSANKHIPLESAERESEKFASIANKYAKTFFPDVANNILFLRDTPISSGSIFEQELAEVSSITNNVVSNETRQVLSNKDNGNGSGIYYGSAHLLVHDIALPKTFMPILEDQPNMVVPKTIISIGGRQEKFFYRLRHEVKPHLPDRYRQVLTFQFFSRHQVPPYYMASDGDLTFSDSLDALIVGSASRYDLDYLFRTSSKRGDLMEFLEGNV